MFISKKSITKVAALLAFMVVAILPAKAEPDYCKSLLNVPLEPSEYYENQYFKFRLIKGMKVAETYRDYVVGKDLKISKPNAWKDFVKGHVAPLFSDVSARFISNPPKILSEKDLNTNDTYGPYGQPIKGTIKPGKLSKGERFVQFRANRTFPDLANLFSITTVLVKTKDSKFLMIDFPDDSGCMEQRNRMQIALIISSLEMKYSESPTNAVKKAGGVK